MFEYGWDMHSIYYLQAPIQVVEQHLQNSNTSVCGLTYCKPFQLIE